MEDNWKFFPRIFQMFSLVEQANSEPKNDYGREWRALKTISATKSFSSVTILHTFVIVRVGILRIGAFIREIIVLHWVDCDCQSRVVPIQLLITWSLWMWYKKFVIQCIFAYFMLQWKHRLSSTATCKKISAHNMTKCESFQSQFRIS